MGALYGATGGWTVPLLVLIVLLIPQAVAGVLVSRPASSRTSSTSTQPPPPSNPRLANFRASPPRLRATV